MFCIHKQNYQREIFLQTNLNDFLNGVVEYKETEDCFTGQDKVVPNSHIADQFHSAESPRWNCSTSGWELNQKSGNKNQSML